MVISLILVSLTSEAMDNPYFKKALTQINDKANQITAISGLSDFIDVSSINKKEPFFKEEYSFVTQTNLYIQLKALILALNKDITDNFVQLFKRIGGAFKLFDRAKEGSDSMLPLSKSQWVTRSKILSSSSFASSKVIDKLFQEVKKTKDKINASIVKLKEQIDKEKSAFDGSDDVTIQTALTIYNAVKNLDNHETSKDLDCTDTQKVEQQ
jgi:hypothetical protein